MVPIHPFGLLASNTIYKPQEIPQSWITPQVIPHTWDSHTWESLSDISHLDSFSQIFTNKDNNGSHKILVQNFRTQMIQEN